MPGSVQVVKNLGNGFVQVDAKSKKTVPKSYKIPETSADSFCKEYQNNDNKMKKNANLIDFVLMPVALFSSFFLTNRFGLGQVAKFTISTVLAVCTIYGGNYLNINRYIKQKDNIIQKYNAQEITEEEVKKNDAFDKVLK